MEEINDSAAYAMVLSATLDIDAIAEETKGAVKNLDEFRGNLLKEQVSAEIHHFLQIGQAWMGWSLCRELFICRVLGIHCSAWPHVLYSC